MIRINLLGVERPTQKKRAAAAAAGPPGSAQAYLLVGAFVAAALALCAFGWAYKASIIARLDKQIADATARQQALQVIKAKVEAFERKKALLDAKVDLIERLKAQQSGPVHMLDELSKALPDFVWLTSVEQTGATLRISGETNGLTSVADFISNLQRSGWFPRVDLVDTTTDPNRVVKFTLAADFKPIAATPPAALGGGAPAAPVATAAAR